MAIIKTDNEQVASHCGEPFKILHTVPLSRAGSLHLSQWFVKIIVAGLYSLIIHYPSLTGAQVIIRVRGHQHCWLAGGYDLQVGHFRGG